MARRPKYRADVYEDGSVALVRDLPGVLEMLVVKDDVGQPVDSVTLEVAEFEALSKERLHDLKFDQKHKRFAISKPDKDTKQQDTT